MSVATTSKTAYADIKDKLGDKQSIVYETIEQLEPCTNEQIAEHLGWAINRVTGRVNELNTLDMIACVGLGKNISGKSAKQWAVKSPADKQIVMRFANDCAD